MTLYHAYERARDDNLDAVRRAGNGSRNNTLNRAAYATAQLAKAAGFEMVAEKRKLIEAAKACGLDEREAGRTVDSAWKDGEANPRTIGNDNPRYDILPGHAVRLNAGQKIVATYIYGEAGKVHYRKHRVEPGDDGRDKSFRFDHPDGRGGWTWGDGKRPIPYRADDLRASSGLIIMTEGEKHADKLAGWGFNATSFKGWKPEFAQYIAGRPVVILPDHGDDGARQATKALEHVEGAGCQGRIVRLPGLQNDGDDIMDWTGSVEDLRALVQERTTAEKASGIVIRATPYVWREPSAIPPRPWVYGRWFLRGTITGVVAPGGVGKSTMLAGTALALCTGRPLLGKQVWEGQKRVWLWNLEDDLDELSRSIQASAKHYGLTGADVADRLFVDSGMEGASLCTATEEDGFRLLVPVYDALLAELTDRRIDVLVVDPFVSSHEVEENANGKIDKIAKAWARVAKAANCAIVLVHHTSKAGSGEVTAMSARGAVALINACRSTLVLNRMDKERAEQLGIGDDDRRRYFAVEDDKHNRAPAEKADWYRLASVDLGNGDDDGNPGDSVGVAEPWTAPNPFDDLTVGHLVAVQSAIAAGDWKEHHTANDWVGNEVARVLGLDESEKADKARIKALLKVWISEGALKVVEKQDKNRQWKKFVEVGRWMNSAPATPSQSVAEHDVAPEHTAAMLYPSPRRGGGVATVAGGYNAVSQTDGLDDNGDTIGWHDK
ncbi:AAA family ATPase [Sphingobium scionense]|uniref:AAA family ATPase n=1 Tax=Sphingobium scionense TaxID=1404341 RepID=A0A7W6PWH1_9SPHN|nr:AAA family ATPase [Sphingobium scionense]MBB4149818.1 hypothetical protein [Sphingobium scionense]